MDISAAIVAAFGALAAGCIALFGWTLSQTNKLSVAQAGMLGGLREVVERFDKLVNRLDANFSLQISEQVARNVLQEKVSQLERQVSLNRELLEREIGACRDAMERIRRPGRPKEKDE